MERLPRFTQSDSKYYEASDHESTPHGTPKAVVSSSSRTTSRPIDLDELYHYTRQSSRRQYLSSNNRSTTEEKPLPQPPLPPQQHTAAYGADDFKHEWPRFTLHQAAEESAPEYSAPTPPTPPLPRPTKHAYDHNFLHPPTPSRNSLSSSSPRRRSSDDSSSTTGITTEQSDDHHHHRRRPPPPRRASTLGNALGVDIDKSSRFGWWTPLLLLITVLMVTLTALYANGSVKNLMQDGFFVKSSSNAILVLRLLTEACAMLLAGLVVVVVEDLQWALASRPEGVSLLHFVGLDGGTGVWGLIRLLATADWREKYSSLLRLLVLCTIPLPGIVLMGDIEVELVFFPQSTYPVAAGVAEFDGSFFSQVDDTIKTALLISMGSTSWSTRDSWALDSLGPQYGKCTVSANDTSWAPCDESHILTGGILGVTPQIDNFTTFPRSTAYVVPHTRSLQLEFGKVHDLEALYDTGACYTIGTTFAAAYWCTKTGSDGELLFGSSYCPLAVQATGACLTDTTWTKPLEIASSLFVFKRYATVNYDRSNFSVLSVTNLSPPVRQYIDLIEYMTALSAVVPGLSPDNNNNNTTGDNSALAIYAVTALPINDNEIARALSLTAIRKAMAVPLNYFQENYFNNQSIFSVTGPRAGLDADMYTTMSLAVSSHQVLAGPFSRWAFGLLSGILLATCALAIVVTARICRTTPQRCGYPTLDFAAVCAVKGGFPRPGSAAGAEKGEGGGGSGSGSGSGLHRSLTALAHKTGRFQVASRIKGEKIMLG